MASSKVKLRLCLLVFTLFLACVSVGLGAEGESLGSGVEVCRLKCQLVSRQGTEQRRCQQLCEERLKEREQHEEDKRRDPEREREEQRRREHEQEERRRHERERERERGRGRRDENEKDPEREREERHREQERRRREQERRERERRGERDDEDDENRKDPDWRKEQERKEQERRRREQEQRERERRGERDDEDDENRKDPDWRKEQERKEQERRRREQEQRERERRGERDDEDDENRRDPDWRKEQERKEQERRRREQEQRERERRGERDDEDEENQRDPDWRREQERKEQEQREHEREREHERKGGHGQKGRQGQEEQRSREEERQRQRERQHGERGRANQVEVRRTEQEQSHNPYYFQEHRFQSRFKSEDGHWRVLERFSQRSELLKGIKNQRFAILEARPQTFIIPHHFDAECVLLVVKGKAVITTVVQEKKETKKESYNVESGDVMTVSSGTTIYLVNHENEDLQIVKLIQPVNNPGEFKDYLSAGGEAQSYYSVFSNDVLEAALNIPRDRLERIFKQKDDSRGKIIKASPEQLRALSQRATSVRKGSRGTRAPIKLESQTPVYRNQFGQMFEACPDEFPQLRRTDVATAVVEIKQGGMMVPHFNSRATWVVFVSEGSGSFEMACPHVHGDQDERSGQIERVAGRLSQGGVLVIPAGHPIAIMASPNENLRLVGFGINGENNRRNFLAGKENIMNEVDREAKELTFNVEGKQADEIFKSQKESFFTKGPSTERSSLMSILKLANCI